MKKPQILTKVVFARVPEHWFLLLEKEAYDKHMTLSELIRDLIKPEGA